MTKKEKILKNISEDKDIMKGINKNSYYSVESFYSDVIDYIKAIKEKRMLCIIHSVSSSGMSRNISFHSCKKNKIKSYWYRQYCSLFESLGYTQVGDKYQYRIQGCGMDMIFHTNYTNIHDFYRLGFITREECDHLAQQTPTVL